jgi:MoaA/NifB/PqqE/SkfB family radical SAM enzyme
MCNIWQNRKSPQWEVDELERIFSQPELSDSVEVVNITGGEPTLHKDLFEIVKVAVKQLSVVNTISIQTHGLQPTLLTKRLAPIVSWLADQHQKGTSIHLDINISLDGPDRIHDLVRGCPGAFKAVMDSTRRVKEMMQYHKRMAMLFNCTIVSDNVAYLRETQSIADQCEVELTYTLPQDTDVYMANLDSQDKYCLTDDQRRVAANFFREILPRTTGSGAMSRRYCEMLIGLLETKERNLGCPLADGGLFMSPDGAAMPCWRSSELHLGDLRKLPVKEVLSARENIGYQRKLKTLCRECPSNCYVEWNRRMFARGFTRDVRLGKQE